MVIGNDKDVAQSASVIGSGFGGLATGIRLQKKGYKTTIYERLDKPGGRAYVFSKDGFTFDSGPTIITAPFLLSELWEMCGKKFEDFVDLRPMSPFYRIRFHDGTFFDYSGDHEKMNSYYYQLFSALHKWAWVRATASASA